MLDSPFIAKEFKAINSALQPDLAKNCLI
jgi:hypothetical protein